MSMVSTWIYAFADSGYDRGVKVGRSSTAYSAWNDAPSYSPRPMLYRAGWEVELPEQFGTTRGVAASAVERRLHQELGSPLSFPRNGREWFNLEPSAAVECISRTLGLEPKLVDGHRRRPVTNDQFRNPHPRKLGEHPRKIVAWIYREHSTDRLKTQCIDDWTTPFEVRRRYSRNGFEEVAAFSYTISPTVELNRQVHAAWAGVMTQFGPGIDDTFYGWLAEGTSVGSVSSSYQKAGLMALPLDRARCPVGVKMAYNRSQ